MSGQATVERLKYDPHVILDTEALKIRPHAEGAVARVKWVYCASLSSDARDSTCLPTILLIDS
jgi:hypothetical protein